jgi:signal transduction histidine kinase
MRRRLPRGTRITIEERYDDVPSVLANAELLEWALENLVANALSALQQNTGRIEVTVGRTEREVEIVVTDTGRGMTPAEQSRAFEPGYTTRRRGWGLGLPLTRRVVEEYHQGRVFIRKSAPGQGTTVVVRLRV